MIALFIDVNLKNYIIFSIGTFFYTLILFTMLPWFLLYFDMNHHPKFFNRFKIKESLKQYVCTDGCKRVCDKEFNYFIINCLY